MTLADDVAAEVARLQRERGLGMSEAVNELARAGMSRPREEQPFRQRGAALGL